MVITEPIVQEIPLAQPGDVPPVLGLRQPGGLARGAGDVIRAHVEAPSSTGSPFRQGWCAGPGHSNDTREVAW